MADIIPGSDRLAALLRDNLRRHWLEDPITRRCFDYNDARIDILVAFIDGAADRAGRADASDHLIECPRCRYIYGEMRRAADQRKGKD